VTHVCGHCGARYPQAGTCPHDGGQLVLADDPLLGLEVGRYRLVRVLGQGGMGRVYAAVQPDVGSRVAIKVISEEFARDRELAERFFAEARAVNMIRHENIVNVLDLTTLPDGRPVIVMELIDGHTLRSIVRAGPTPLGGVVHVMIDVLSALAAAHAAGVVHRDLKPDNILVTASGRAKVLDFGIAKLARALPGQLGPRTRTGAVLGTPEYMAPEQISGGHVDARTDIYAAGVVLFEAMTGRRPFDGDSDFEVMRAHVDHAPPSARALRPEIPDELANVIACALAKRPSERFANATAMANALYGVSTLLGAEQWRSLTPEGRAISRPFAPAPAPATRGFTEGPAERSGSLPTAGARPGNRDRAVAPTRVERAPTRARRPWGLIAIGAVAAVAGGGAVIVVATRSGSPASDSTISAGSAGPPSVSASTTPATIPADAVGLERGDGSERTSPTPVAVAPPTPRPVTPARGEPPGVDREVRGAAPVVVAPAPAPAPATSSMRPIDYDPKRFDGSAYAAKALALARTIYPDAGFVDLQVNNVFPSGLSDLSLGDDFASSYTFRSPSHSARPAGVPKNVNAEVTCYIGISVGVRRMLVSVASPTEGNCSRPIRSLPKCTLAQVWARAKAAGADPDTVAKITFLDDGEWVFDNTFEKSGVFKSFSDECR